MWWSVETERDQSTKDTVYRLNDHFLTPSRSIEHVHGVGSVAIDQGQHLPLLIIDHSLAPKRPWNPFYRLVDVARAFLSPLVRRSPHQQRAHLLTPLFAANEEVRKLLADWDVPDETLLIFSEPPISAQPAPGTRVWTSPSGKDATAGFYLEVDDGIALSTAGHFVNDPPCSVFTRHKRLLRPDQFEQIGSAVFSNDPTASPGADLALVELIEESSAGSRIPAKLAHAPRVLPLAKCTLLGGRSYRTRGWVGGDLLTTKALDGRVWENCWIINEIDGGIAQRGDSGGSVILETIPPIVGKPPLLGHLVAVMGVKRPTGRYQCGVVQDIHALLDCANQQYAGPVTVLHDGLSWP